MSFAVIARPTRAYRGQRARRQAFYERRRLARLLTALMRSTDHNRVVSDAYIDALIYGSAWIEMTAQGQMRRMRPLAVLLDK